MSHRKPFHLQQLVRIAPRSRRELLELIEAALALDCAAAGEEVFAQLHAHIDQRARHGSRLPVIHA